MMKRKHLRFGLAMRREMKGALFCLPWVVGFLAFFLWPLIRSFYFSLHNIKFAATGMRIAFKGLDNYEHALFKNAEFVNQLSTFWMNTVLTLIFVLVFALVLALLLQSLEGRAGKGFFRTLYFLPVVLTSGPVLKRLISIGSTQIANVAGVNVNELILRYLPTFLATPLTYFFDQLVMILWYCGVPLLVFMTALQKIDKNQYDAALIDGASGWVVFWKITMPTLRPFIMINAFYTLVFLATSEMNALIDIIKAAMTGSYGYGMSCAMAWIFSATILLALGIIALLCRERKGTKVEVIRTREQMAVERMHRQRAERRKAG